jgi:hypothetical protein
MCLIVSLLGKNCKLHSSSLPSMFVEQSLQCKSSMFLQCYSVRPVQGKLHLKIPPLTYRDSLFKGFEVAWFYLHNWSLEIIIRFFFCLFSLARIFCVSPSAWLYTWAIGEASPTLVPNKNRRFCWFLLVLNVMNILSED